MKVGRSGKMFSFFPFRFHNARSRRPKDGGLRDMEGGRCVLSNGGIRLGSKEKSFDRGRPDCDYDLSDPFRIILFILDCS